MCFRRYFSFSLPYRQMVYVGDNCATVLEGITRIFAHKTARFIGRRSGPDFECWFRNPESWLSAISWTTVQTTCCPADEAWTRERGCYKLQNYLRGRWWQRKMTLSAVPPRSLQVKTSAVFTDMFSCFRTAWYEKWVKYSCNHGVKWLLECWVLHRL